MAKYNWVEKHRPEKWSDIQGNNKSIKKIKKWARSWREGDPPQLLVGEPGTGKTTTAYVVAEQMGWELNEINTSSARKTEDVKEIAREMRAKSIDDIHQLIFLDEVDSWHHSVSISPLADALDNPRNPVMMAANDGYQVPASIKRKVESHGRNDYLKFSLSKPSRRSKLEDIAEREGLDLSDDHIEVLAERNDLRSAINDLQLYYESGKAPGSDDREMNMSEWEAVDNIIRGEKEVGYNIRPSDFIMWLDENVSNKFRGLEAAMAYKSLALSDFWLGVAYPENTRFIKYSGEFQEQVANLRLSEPYDGYINKDFPNWFRSSTNRINDGSPEASLFKKVKSLEDGRFEFGGDYTYFRKILLPILQSLDDEVKYEIALENRLDGDEMEVLGIKETEYNEWRNTEDESSGDVTQTNALDW